jgi:hypothetical protein
VGFRQSDVDALLEMVGVDSDHCEQSEIIETLYREVESSLSLMDTLFTLFNSLLISASQPVHFPFIHHRSGHYLLADSQCTLSLVHLGLCVRPCSCHTRDYLVFMYLTFAVRAVFLSISLPVFTWTLYLFISPRPRYHVRVVSLYLILPP